MHKLIAIQYITPTSQMKYDVHTSILPCIFVVCAICKWLHGGEKCDG